MALPCSSMAAAPRGSSCHSTGSAPAAARAASTIRTEAGSISGPMPSPSITPRRYVRFMALLLGRGRGDGRLVQDEPGADVDELADAGRGQLPPVAAGAGAAEGHPDVGRHHGVDEDGARADPAGDGDPPLGIGRPDARAEAEAG